MEFGYNIPRLASKKRLRKLYLSPPSNRIEICFKYLTRWEGKWHSFMFLKYFLSPTPRYDYPGAMLFTQFYTPRDILQATWSTLATWNRGTCTTCWPRSTSGTRRTRGHFRRFSHPCWTWTRKTGRRPLSVCWILGCWRSGWPLLRDEPPRHAPVTHFNPTQTQEKERTCVELLGWKGGRKRGHCWSPNLIFCGIDDPKEDIVSSRLFNRNPYVDDTFKTITKQLKTYSTIL